MRGQKLHNYLNMYRKSIWQNLIPIHDKNSATVQQNRLSQCNKSHLPKKKPLVSMEKGWKFHFKDWLKGRDIHSNHFYLNYGGVSSQHNMEGKGKKRHTDQKNKQTKLNLCVDDMIAYTEKSWGIYKTTVKPTK